MIVVSNVSKGFGVSNRSTPIITQTTFPTMITIWVKSSGCSKTRERNSNKQSKNTNTTSISNEKCASNSRTNSSSSKINLAGKTLACQSLNSRSIICYIKIRIQLLITKDSSISQGGQKNFMDRRSINQKHSCRWRRRILKRLLCSIMQSLRNSRNRGNNMLSS